MSIEIHMEKLNSQEKLFTGERTGIIRGALKTAKYEDNI